MAATEKTVRTVNCPNCGKPVQWLPENKYRPFCSERCKQIDIGAWASESYRIAGPEEPTDADLTGDLSGELGGDVSSDGGGRFGTNRSKTPQA